ncbi:helix-turn-helix domain-containing protein [Candidatus Saccharibacteria bacterium]|nr:helix-turn-helix domain-containing protein [Achromobacter sp.]MBQ2649467.1 helix-turn-helix domain-containing protein [Achromobacter sp.]MBQ6321009.1 helix-turn-helix domain-containing protein [Candidatus Saccharibacteria bacterium]
MTGTGKHVSTTTPINGDMLKKELKKRGLRVGEVGEAMGYSPSYLSQAVRSGRVSNRAVVLLETLYNLPVTAYQYVEEPEKADEPKETQAGFFTLDDVVAEIKTLNGRLKNIEDLVDYLADFVEWFRGAAERAEEDLKEATDAVVEIATRTEG